MSALAKVFVVFVFILSVIFFGASATLFKTRLDWKKAYLEAEKGAEEKFKELEAQITALSKLHDANVQTITQLKLQQDQLSQLLKTCQSDLAVEKKNLQIAKEQVAAANTLSQQLALNLKTVEEDRSKLRGELDTARGEMDKAKEEADQAKKERDAMRVDLDAVQIALHQARASLKEISDRNETVELVLARYAQIYGPLGAPVPPIDGVVQAVEPKEKLVVLSVGENYEVKPGYTFTVFRDDRFIGRVKVTRVFANLSGAQIEWTQDGEEIQTGDKATTRIVGVN
ncbi:MAG: hypothetical protein ACUVYA_14755 [Planctomycetota bacterium]